MDPSAEKTSTTTTGADRVFLDTSLIVAASVEEHPQHAAADAYVATLKGEQASVCFTLQVCREFMVALTRKPIGPRNFTVPEALAALRIWYVSSVLLDGDNKATREEWLRLVEKYDVRGKQVHDTAIVAAMIVYGVKRLGTRNPDDFKRYAALIDIEAISP